MPSIWSGNNVPNFPTYFASRAERKEWTEVNIQTLLTVHEQDPQFVIAQKRGYVGSHIAAGVVWTQTAGALVL